MRSSGMGWGYSPTIGFELWADSDGLTHRLHVPGRYADYVVTQLRSLVAGTRVTPEAVQPGPAWTRAVEVGIRGSRLPLRIYSLPDVAASMLASVQLLGQQEVLLVQWVMTPALPTRPPQQYRAPARPASRLDALLLGGGPNRDVVNERHRKLEEPNLLAVLRVAVFANSPNRADQLVARLRAALAATRGPHAHFVRRFVTDKALAARIAEVAGVATYPIQLSAPEVVALIAWPVGEPHVAGLPASRSRHLAPSGTIARQGLVVARSNFPGAERPLAVSRADACKHLHIVGPIGVGKTALAGNLLTQAMDAKAGVIAMESKGDLFRLALDAIPASRLSDVIVVDVSDSQPVGYNVLAEGNPRIAVEEICQLFEHLYPDMRRGIWARAALHRGMSTLI